MAGNQPEPDQPEPRLASPGQQWEPRLPEVIGNHHVAPRTERPTPIIAIPPLETTSPANLVAASPGSIDQSKFVRPIVGMPPSELDRFAPLRVDPPPRQIPTWWLRWVLFGSMLAAPGLALRTEYAGESGDLFSSPIVVIAHTVLIASLLIWSFCAMHNAHVLIPPSRYQHRSRGWVAVGLWLAALSAPLVAREAHSRLSLRLDQQDDVTALLMFAGVVMWTFMVVWLPFRYHSRQAARIGAPHRAALAWFWGPMLATVGGLSISGLGLRDLLADEGIEPIERFTQLAVLYGLPMVVLALTTWRATTVFDEVLEIRWRRWKTEWEQTLEEFASQPAPGPEGSPSLAEPPDL